jgi:group II intron reverse transcriptase/maturase
VSLGRHSKGPTITRIGKAATSAILRGGKAMETKLERIAELAERDPQCRFTSLAHLLNEENLKECYWELKRDAAAGADGRTWEEYGEELNENISDLVRRLKAKKYWPRPVKRTYIPKEGKPEMRPIGIPALEEKIVQRAIAKILTAIFEADFLDISYGFRPGRSPHDALDAVDKTVMARPVNWILDADIEGFFDNVDHEWMMRCLEQRIKDRTLLKLIRRFLKAGIIEEGKYYETDRGTPQGGNLSPVLSNIYLHYVLDFG